MLCALALEEPCPTFRPDHPEGLRPPQQMHFVFRQERRRQAAWAFPTRRSRRPSTRSPSSHVAHGVLALPAHDWSRSCDGMSEGPSGKSPAWQDAGRRVLAAI